MGPLQPVKPCGAGDGSRVVWIRTILRRCPDAARARNLRRTRILTRWKLRPRQSLWGGSGFGRSSRSAPNTARTPPQAAGCSPDKALGEHPDRLSFLRLAGTGHPTGFLFPRQGSSGARTPMQRGRIHSTLSQPHPGCRTYKDPLGGFRNATVLGARGCRLERSSGWKIGPWFHLFGASQRAKALQAGRGSNTAFRWH